MAGDNHYLVDEASGSSARPRNRRKYETRHVKCNAKWLFAVLATGMLVSSGLYFGIIWVQGPAAGHLAKTVGFGVVEVLMLCGAVSERR